MLKSLLIVLALLSNNVFANKADIIKSLSPYYTDINEQNILSTSVQGLYEIVVKEPKPDVLYISKEGRYLFQGEIIDLQTHTNLTQQLLHGLSKELLDSTLDKNKIIYKADNEKYVINIFTDVDCPYCRKLHRDIGALNALGITVKYMAFPRSGVNTESYYRSVSVWCADDKKHAMNQAKMQAEIPAINCGNSPVIDHLVLAKKLNVVGTPTIFFENGDHIPGYLKPASLLQEMQRSLAKY